MTRASGYTLIEVMVALAVLGIATTGLLSGGTAARLRATERLEYERANQLLEFAADALTRGERVNEEVERALLSALPTARLERSRSGALATVRVTWGTGRTKTRELTVFVREPH